MWFDNTYSEQMRLRKVWSSSIYLSDLLIEQVFHSTIQSCWHLLPLRFIIQYSLVAMSAAASPASPTLSSHVTSDPTPLEISTALDPGNTNTQRDLHGCGDLQFPWEPSGQIAPSFHLLQISATCRGSQETVQWTQLHLYLCRHIVLWDTDICNFYF